MFLFIYISDGRVILLYVAKSGKGKRLMARKILLVDDAPAIVHAVSQILRVMGYEVITADGTEVMQMMTEQHPDLLLLDIWMSGCDGRDICRQIKGHAVLCLTPVLLF